MGWDGSADYFNQGCLFAEVGGQCVVGLADKELGRLFEEGGQVSDSALLNIICTVLKDWPGLCDSSLNAQNLKNKNSWCVADE